MVTLEVEAHALFSDFDKSEVITEIWDGEPTTTKHEKREK